MEIRFFLEFRSKESLVLSEKVFIRTLNTGIVYVCACVCGVVCLSVHACECTCVCVYGDHHRDLYINTH